MEKTEIVSSRVKAFALFVASLGFVLAGVVAHERIGDGWFWWFGQTFFSVCALGCLWLIVRPHRLLLDDEGFTLSGGLHWLPWNVAWRDVEEFVSKPGPWGSSLIKIKFRPDVKHVGLARWIGAYRVLPNGWPGSNAEMVNYLNACRINANRRRNIDPRSGDRMPERT